MPNFKFKLLFFLSILIITLFLFYQSRNKRPNTEVDLVTIVVGYQNPTAQTWGSLIMKNQQLFEKYLKINTPNKKFKIKWFNSPSGPPLNNGMIARKIQLAFMGDMPLLSNGASGQNLKSYDSVLIALDGRGIKGKNQSILISKNSKLKSIEDLKGKVLAVPFGTSAHRMALALLKKYNVLN